jgi:hypothetical protein
MVNAARRSSGVTDCEDLVFGYFADHCSDLTLGSRSARSYTRRSAAEPSSPGGTKRNRVNESTRSARKGLWEVRHSKEVRTSLF